MLLRLDSAVGAGDPNPCLQSKCFPNLAISSTGLLKIQQSRVENIYNIHVGTQERQCGLLVEEGGGYLAKGPEINRQPKF